MPIYDYYCKKCNYEEEHIHGMHESVEYICPKCSEKLRIKIGNIEFTIGTGGTIKRTSKDRYMKTKRRDSLPTPTESAREKASTASQEIGHIPYDPSKPYGL